MPTTEAAGRPAVGPEEPSPSRRHSMWTLQEMLRQPISRALPRDPRQPRVAMAAGGAEAAAVRALPELAGARIADGEKLPAAADIVFAALEHGALGDPSTAAARLAAAEPHLAAVLADRESRVAVTDALREAGFARVELAQPPVDGERSWVLFRRSLLLAWADDSR